MSKTIKKKAEVFKAREDGFNLNGIENVKIKEYNALFDPNMRHYFENRKIQKHLFTSGQIDKHGRVIDLDKNKSKLHILEREFKEAEKVEEQRMREEMEMRYRVQRKRFAELERVRKEEVLEKLKFDRDLSKDIISTLRGSTRSSTSLSLTGSSKKGFNGNSLQHAGLFMTESSSTEN